MTVSVAVVGAGQRGQAYARWVREHPERAQLTAVADQDARQRSLAVQGHRRVREFAAWQRLFNGGRVADLAIVSSPDRLPIEPTVAMARAGYHLLIHKPISAAEAEWRGLVEAVRDAGVLFGVDDELSHPDGVTSLMDMFVRAVETGAGTHLRVPVPRVPGSLPVRAGLPLRA